MSTNKEEEDASGTVMHHVMPEKEDSGASQEPPSGSMQEMTNIYVNSAGGQQKPRKPSLNSYLRKFVHRKAEELLDLRKGIRLQEDALRQLYIACQQEAKEVCGMTEGVNVDLLRQCAQQYLNRQRHRQGITIWSGKKREYTTPPGRKQKAKVNLDQPHPHQHPSHPQHPQHVSLVPPQHLQQHAQRYRDWETLRVS